MRMSDGVGDRIRALRDRHGLKQQELADKIGVSRQVLSNWERGYTPLSTEGLIELTKLFETSANFILYGRNAKSKSPAQTISEALEDDEELFSFFNEISKRPDLKLLFKQTKDLSPKTIRQIIRYIKIVEDEEADE